MGNTFDTIDAILDAILASEEALLKAQEVFGVSPEQLAERRKLAEERFEKNRAKDLPDVSLPLEEF